MAGVLSPHERWQLETRVNLLLNRIGINATEALDKARHALQAQANITHQYHICRANMTGWQIEVIGKLPAQVGLSRLLPKDD
ncbi:hypothetical protein WP8W19C03_17040 [Aeromonas veronii]|nr:hypothetical protein [Aeromonas veronii]BBS17470.1 hypothetical protein WP5W18E02_25070 [Aeromonas caviae]BBT95010.1 hypothetical protein WP8W19C03_17040 [Aeromonas veronii]